MICTDLLTFTLDGLEKYMMQEFLEIPLSTHKGVIKWNISRVEKTIAQEEVPLVLEDPAPLLPSGMKPYVDNGHLSRDQWKFNYHVNRES